MELKKLHEAHTATANDLTKSQIIISGLTMRVEELTKEPERERKASAVLTQSQAKELKDFKNSIHLQYIGILGKCLNGPCSE